MKKILLLVMMGVIMLGCGKKLNVSDIKSKEFALTNPLGDFNITLKVEENGNINGFSGVNRYMGPAEIKDGKMKVGMLAGTLMAGPEDKMKAEGEFRKMLSDADTIEYKDGKLMIKLKNGKKLEFQEVK
ncbi:META domain-containing protein [Fusobacterium sp. PH5-44]|uniref:META domain-containing protein n=1 Tax=unclassified Fusobacterium TaxID=2648384 RepID=UPI003D1DAFC7